MTSLEAAIRRVEGALSDAFGALDAWFDKEDAVRCYRPEDEGWTIDEVLEHVGLTTFYLLIIIRRQAQKAIRRAAQRPPAAIPVAADFDRLDAIGEPDAFWWQRPEHMEPTGRVAASEVRALLRQQQEECLAILGNLANGEGALVSVGMSVNKLGKIDLYQWLYFVARHATRHLAQMAGNEDEYRRHRAVS